MVGIPRPATFTRAASSIDSTAIVDDAVGAVDIANTLVHDLDAKTTPVGADSIMISDSEDSYANKEVTITNLMNVVAGTQASTGLTDATGVLTVSPADNAITIGADSLVYMTAAGVPKKDLVSDVADAMAGTMLNAASGVISHEATGQMGVGTIRFGATGDCTSVTIGAVTYPYNGSPDTALGQWAYGASASESATNLAAAINLKTDSPYAATANTDTVHVYAKTAGTAGNVTITRTGGAQPATVENTVGGLAAATKQWCMRAHTVTANDVDTAVLVNIPMPFTPTMFTYSCRSSTGAPVVPTDLFTIGTAPARIVITGSGGTHLVATDVVTIMAHE